MSSYISSIMKNSILKSLFKVAAAMLALCTSLSAQTFPDFAGTYQGLLVDTSAGDPVGRIDFIATATGAVSGSLYLKNQKSYKFKSALTINEIDNTVYFENIDVVKPKEGLELKLSLEIATDGSFTVDGNALVPNLTTDFVEAEDTTARMRLFNAKTDLCPWAGNYTMAFYNADNNGDTSIPGGASIATATVKADGVMSVKSVLADGTKITASTRPSEDGTYRFFFAPNKTAGSYFYAIFTLSEREDGWYQVDENQGTARWVKAANIKDKSYRDGFDVSFDTSVVQWVPPAKGETLGGILGLGEANILDIDFFDGLSTSTYAAFLPSSLGLTAKNTFRIASALGGPSVTDDKAWAKIFSGKVNPKTGLINITININDTVNGKVIKRKIVVTGVFKQLINSDLDQPYAFGHLLIPPLDKATQTLTSGGFDLPGPIQVDEVLAANLNTAGTYSALLTLLPNPSPLPSGVPADGALVDFSISSNLNEMTFAGLKIPLIGDSRPVSLVYSNASKSPTKNLTVTVYLNGSGTVTSLATQYFQVSGFNVGVRNHTSNTVTKK